MSKEKILVVDDEQDLVKLVRFHLEKEGYKVLSAYNGEDALFLSRKDRPELIILDLMLPGIDGLEVCKKLKSDPELANIAIVMLTAKGEEVDITVGLKLGADDYVTKPFSPKELVARVQAVLRRAKSTSTTKDIIKINTSPLLNITQIAQSFARGNFARKAETDSSGEIGDLANAINTMGTELQSRMQTILDDKNKLDAIMANMNDAIITTDLQERIILINNAAKSMFGISKVILNKDFLWEKIRNEKLCSL